LEEGRRGRRRRQARPGPQGRGREETQGAVRPLRREKGDMHLFARQKDACPLFRARNFGAPMSLFGFLEDVGRLAHFAWRTLAARAGALLRPGPVVNQRARVLLGALPRGLAGGLAIGAVVWLHLRDALVQVAGPGALRYLPQALSLAVVLEFGPLSAGFLVAG